MEKSLKKFFAGIPKGGYEEIPQRILREIPEETSQEVISPGSPRMNKIKFPEFSSFLQGRSFECL